MFNLFKKNKNISSKEITFLECVINSLPRKYSYLYPQVNTDFILESKVNELGEEGTFKLILNANLEKEYINKNLPNFFIVKDIKVLNKKLKKYNSIELHIVQGMLFGYRLDCNLVDLDLTKICIKNISEKHFNNEDLLELQEILGNVSEYYKNQLDIESTFKIELADGNYYTIKNLSDGNYLAVNIDGHVYKLIHDPYEVSFLSRDIEQLIKNNELDGQRK